jgi:hypothetical protein
MRARGLICIVVAFLLAGGVPKSVPAFAEIADDFVGIAPGGGNTFYALTANGTLLWFRNAGDVLQQGNIPQIAGHSAATPFVALSSRWVANPCEGELADALTANGNYYYKLGTGQWTYAGNVASLAGHPTQG